ncbi:MAG: 6-phosphogluconolactonase [Candidatus Electrothrix aestuarii]|uniref:6-phosphogluconolactonase n=1 Tax=Candidatus Electrothrix aestuarii TaxID=3062594 RepID=A0AAU8M0Q9_9BACT|nr:6-phosphogluconolactonase [Candidatus Electrothrix aestuarii]
MVELFFQDSETLVADLAGRIGQSLQEHIDAHGWASMAVSGGSTPKPLFKRLSTIDISWQDVVITLVDERWVAPSSPDSNQYLIYQYLLQGRAAAATFVGLKNFFPTAAQGARECELKLRKLARPFTVLVLGMGNDGHIASLFPGSPQLAAATGMHSGKICMALTPADAPYERMTLTLPAILDSQEIILHITGEKKKAVLAKAQEAGPAEELPIRFILRQQACPVTVYWAP